MSVRRSWAWGWRSSSNHVVVTDLIAVYLVVTLTAAIRSEEAFLRRTFGDRYDRYRAEATARQTTRRRFSLAQAIANREHRALVGLPSLYCC